MRERCLQRLLENVIFVAPLSDTIVAHKLLTLPLNQNYVRFCAVTSQCPMQNLLKTISDSYEVILQ